MKTKIALLIGLMLAGGCTSYYRVTDPTTNKVYYTTSLRQMDSGAAVLTDARTGDKVSIQNSQVQKITKEQFETNKNLMPATAK